MAINRSLLSPVFQVCQCFSASFQALLFECLDVMFCFYIKAFRLTFPENAGCYTA